MPSNHVTSIIAANGYLWLGTESGLCRFDPRENHAQTFTSIPSLSKVSFNRNSCCVLLNGKLAFGTNKGAVLFYPESLGQTVRRGRIFFSDLIVSGRSIREGGDDELYMPLDSLKSITLNYNRNTFTLEALPLGEATDEYKFSWKMEGFDDNWSYASKYHRMTYTNLPSGVFALNIRLLDGSSSQLLDERRILFNIKPPFWKTWWFMLVLIALAAGVVAFLLQYYINRIRHKHSKEKIRFFANIAHDIRGSLTLIKAPVEELNRETNLSDKGKQYLEMATTQTRKLSEITTQLLDFQKSDIGKMQISLKMTDIVHLVSCRKWMFDALARSKNITLEFSTNEQRYISVIDEHLMEKVIDNLILNAIKYSHPDSEVHITLNCGQRSWELSVRDSGIGISHKAQSKLFREFYRSENAVNSNIAGSGIGLLLAKNYVAMHGGTIHCTSQENVGSTFWFVIPYKNIGLSDVERIPDMPGLSEQSSSQTSDGNRMHLLIVEDSEDLQKFITLALQNEFHIEKAGNGKEAWEKIKTQMPDLVLSDVMMPEMDGFELCRLIKSTYETSHIPVVLLTSLTGKTEQLHGLGLGADNYLTKPFDIELVKQRIKSIIQNRKAIREKALKMIDRKKGDEVLYVNELNDKFIKKAIEVIHANIDNQDFRKGEFASAMCLSGSLLYKKLKSLTDQSPADFIRAIRLNHSVELLQTGKYTITEVSEMCGFSSANYFCFCFKKYFGKTPGEI